MKKKLVHGADQALAAPRARKATQVRRHAAKLPLLLSTSMTLIGGFSYFQRAYGQTVLSGSLSTYNADPVQLQGPGLFETSLGFSVDTTNSQNFGGRDAIVITSTGTSSTDSLTFRDNSAGQITSSLNDAIDAQIYFGALSITTNSVLDGGRRGIVAKLGGLATRGTSNETSLTISANQVTGEDGIDARNYGVGDLDITVTGDIVATDGQGIRAQVENSVSGDTVLSIAAQNITSSSEAISVISRGAGQISVTVDGDISAGRYGIYSFSDENGNTTNVDTTIVANGNISSYLEGIMAKNYASGGNIEITSTGSIQITGLYYDGVYVKNTGDSIDVTVQDITASGYGIYAANSGSGHLIITSRGSIVGDYEGIRALQGNPSATGNIEIRVHDVAGGNYGNGIYANNNGRGNLIITSDGTITTLTSGSSGIASFSGDGDTVISVNNVSGPEHGLDVFQMDGSVSIDVAGAVTGDDGDGINFRARGTADLTITIAEGGSVSTAGADAANDFAVHARADLGVAMTINNAGTVTGQVNLSNVGSNLDSANLFTNTGTWNLAGTASNFAANAESAVVNSGLVIAAGDAATAETSLIDNLDTFRNNAGATVRLADGAAGDVFRIGATASGDGNFVANGGTVELDVVLGGDGSAADRLQIDGDVILDTAPTTLAITSVGGGTGGETVTGIELVRVGGTSAAGAFVLANPVEVGALAYSLSQGQCDNTANANWYLCSTGRIGTTGAVFEAMPGIVLDTFADSAALHQRLSTRIQGADAGVTLSSRGAADHPLANAIGPWVRTWGHFESITPDNTTADTSWNADSWGFEAGIGAIIGDHANGTLIGGLNQRYRATHANLSNPVGTATLSADGFGLSAALTWFGNDGFYVDGVAAVDVVTIDASSESAGALVEQYEDVVYSVSAEVGRRINLQGSTTLVPQAQLSWGRMRNGALTDNLGNVVSISGRETLNSRIGLTVEQEVSDTTFGAGRVFGFGNVTHDLESNLSATIAGTDVTQGGTGDWIELGGGFSLQPTQNTNLFGQASYREAFDGVSGDAIAVSAGWRMQW